MGPVDPAGGDYWISEISRRFEQETHPLIDLARRIGNSEPERANESVAAAMSWLAKGSTSEDFRTVRRASDNAIFFSVLAELYSLKLSFVAVFAATVRITEFLQTTEPRIDRDLEARLEKQRTVGAMLLRDWPARWDAALHDSDQVWLYMESERQTTLKVFLLDALEDALSLYDDLRARYPIAGEFGQIGLTDRETGLEQLDFGAPRPSEKYAESDEAKFELGWRRLPTHEKVYCLVAVGLGLIAFIRDFLPRLEHLAERFQVGASSWFIGFAHAETSPGISPPLGWRDIEGLVVLSGIFAVLAVCLTIVVRKQSDRTTAGWARDLIKMIVGFFVGHFTKFGT